MESEKRWDDTSEVTSLERRRRLLTCLRSVSRITMILTVILVLLLYFQQGNGFHQKQITQPAGVPQRFFPAHSHVVDYPYGYLQPVVKLLEDEELIFVMYYAPWCAESIRVREEFLRAAKVLSTTVKFAAVNCWYSSGECRQRMKFYSFPELFVYHKGVADGYRFTGIKEAEYFVRFAEGFLYPLIPLRTQRQITEFTAQNDNTVIGYFDFHSSPQPPGLGYNQFYLTALRVMSYDIYQPIRFGLVQKPDLAYTLNLTTPNTFIMTRIGNTTLKYPVFYNLTAKNMTTWIMHFKQKNLAPLLVPPGIKSLTLSVHMQRGPAVFVFAPANSLLRHNPNRDIVQIASYAIRSCGNNTKYYENLLRTYIQNSVVANYEAREYQKKCLKKKSSVYNRNLSSSSSKCCVSLLTGSSKPNSVCEYCVQRNLDSDTVCDIRPDLNSFLSPIENLCSNFYQYYNINEYHSVCCKKSATSIPNIHIKKLSGRVRWGTDPYVINGENTMCQQYLNKLTLQKTKRLPSLDDVVKIKTLYSDIDKGNITGLQCRTNKTIDFYYVDSVYSSVYLENLNLPVQPNRTTVILVDLKDEAVYLFRDKFNYVNLAHFVMNYTDGLLRRYTKSTDVLSPSECSRSTSVCITEITAETFQESVLNSNKDVLLMFYSHICGFCAQLSKVFLATAHYFKGAKDLVFARVNGDTNDLPWEYSVDKYPTIILFSANRKSDSIKFPDDVAKTVPNLIKFILYYANISLQIDSAVNSCSEQCVKRNMNLVLKKISELETIIGKLGRRATTLWSYVPETKHSREFQKVALDANKKAQDMKNFKLRKAQMLNYFLQDDIKRLDKRVFLAYMARFASL